jgi:predicted transcriptional regulator
MRIVWDRGYVRAEEVRLAMDKKYRLKDSTVRTLLRRLEAKGILEHTVDGVAYVYRPKIEPEHMAAKAVRGIAERFCQGSIPSLLLGMADNSMISADELRRLADRIEQAEQAQAKSVEKKQT